jgi:hypothetical protein
MAALHSSLLHGRPPFLSASWPPSIPLCFMAALRSSTTTTKGDTPPSGRKVFDSISCRSRACRN